MIRNQGWGRLQCWRRIPEWTDRGRRRPHCCEVALIVGSDGKSNMTLSLHVQFYIAEGQKEYRDRSSDQSKSMLISSVGYGVLHSGGILRACRVFALELNS